MRKILEKYMELLLSHNKEINLTAIDEPEDVWVRHFEDSLMLTQFYNFTGAKILDFGAGAGFPGLPIVISEPTANLTLLDAAQKKIEFLQHVCDELGLTGVTCIHGRGEVLAQTVAYRNGYDYVLARGVAKLNILSELCLPFLRIGGTFIAMKEDECEAEVEEAKNAIHTLGCELEHIKKYKLSGGIQHAAVAIRKVNLTPKTYPRRFAKIKSKPL